MERSYYTVLVEDEGAVIAYSTRTQGMVELSPAEAALFDDPDGCGDADCVAPLRQAGIIVEDAEAEADEMLYRQHQCRYNKHLFELTISLSRLCNFRCDYCYVPVRPGVMSDDTQDAVMALVSDVFARNRFAEMRVNWYGGEPLLCVDEMERLSGMFLDFCARNGVSYHGHILSNASLADEETSRRLAQNCGILTVMPTISGYGDMHDYQRPARDGCKYFDTIIDNIGHMVDAGIRVHVNYVTNKNNIEECTRLASELCRREGVSTRLSSTGAFGKQRIVLRDGKDTPLELFTPEEFGPHCVEFHRALGLDAEGYEEALAPIPLYCAALVDSSYFIDETGDVFRCMVDMDYPERAVFNVNDWARGDRRVKLDRVLAYGNLEPIRDLACRTCRILPLCQGGCYEKFLASGMLACHKFKSCIEGLVRDYYRTLVGKPLE